MGIKFLSFHALPWCFHLLGNHISCMQMQLQSDDNHHHHHHPMETIKIIKSDGLVKIYTRPIHVSELMLEFPKHLVCRSDSFYIGQKIPALSENDMLQLGHKYFLLPKHLFQSVLSFVTIASFASESKNQRNAFVKKAAAASCQPFDIQKSASGCLRIRISDEFLSQLIEDGRMKEDVEMEKETVVAEEEEDSGEMRRRERVCTTPQLQKDYKLLVRSKQWKPKLETIKEIEMKKKKMKKLSSFGMMGMKKLSQSQNQKQESSTRVSEKTKIRFRSGKS